MCLIKWVFIFILKVSDEEMKQFLPSKREVKCVMTKNLMICLVCFVKRIGFSKSHITTEQVHRKRTLIGKIYAYFIRHKFYMKTF